MTNAGGPGIACADACAAAGLRVEPLARTPCAAGCAAHLPDARRGRQPGRHDRLGRRPRTSGARSSASPPSPTSTRSIAIFIPPLVTRAADVAAAIRAAARDGAAGTPLLAVFMAATDAERAALAGDGAVPVYGTPEEAVRALGHVDPLRRLAPRRARRAAGARPASTPTRSPPCSPRALAARRRLARARATSRRSSRAYGIPLVESRFAATAAAAGRCAAELGGPVALKAVAPGLVHKADAGGVALGLERPGRGRRARRAAMAARCAPPGTSPRASSSSGWRRPAPS